MRRYLVLRVRARERTRKDSSQMNWYEPISTRSTFGASQLPWRSLGGAGIWDQSCGVEYNSWNG